MSAASEEEGGLDDLCEAVGNLGDEELSQQPLEAHADDSHNVDGNVVAPGATVLPRASTLKRARASSGVQKGVSGLGDLGHGYAKHVAQRKKMESRATSVPDRDSRGEMAPKRVFQDVGQGALISKYSGLRISKALISSAQLKSTLESLSFIKIDQLRQRIIQDTVPKRWCTIGVVGEVSTPRTAQNAKGGQYCIWKLTDLKECMMMVYVFGNAFNDFRYDVKPGTLVCIVSGRTRRSADAVTLSIDDYSQLIVCGDSVDFGYCSGTRKDGQPCRIPVNKHTCEYCAYHVGAAYRQISSLRRELQGGSLSTAFHKSKSKLRWTVGRFEKKDATASNNNRLAKKEDLKQAAAKSMSKNGSMGSKYLVTCADPLRALHQVKEEDARRKRLIADGKYKAAFDKAPIPSKHLPAVVVSGAHMGTMDIQRTRENSLQQAKKPVTSLARTNLSLVQHRKHIGKQQDSTDLVQLHGDEAHVSSYAMDLSSSLPARAQAAAIWKKVKTKEKEGQRQSEAPSFLAKSLEAHHMKAGSSAATCKAQTRSPKKPAEALEKKLAGPLSPTKEQLIQSTENRVFVSTKESKPNSFEALFGDVIKEMQTSTNGNPVHSRYKHIVEAADDHDLMQTLNVLEKKDDLAQKMDSVKALKVSAFKCAKCLVITEKRHERCFTQHPEALTRIDAMKRWWKCSDCKKVFTTLGVNYPTGACIKCNSNQATFEKHSMYQPMSKTREGLLTDGVACKENMLPRGREQKWVNE